MISLKITALVNQLKLSTISLRKSITVLSPRPFTIIFKPFIQIFVLFLFLFWSFTNKYSLNFRTLSFLFLPYCSFRIVETNIKTPGLVFCIPDLNLLCQPLTQLFVRKQLIFILSLTLQNSTGMS